MNQKQLEYFTTVYRYGNVQLAADKLFVTRQGVSKLIRQLEDELQQQLFIRTSKGVIPTDFAVQLLPKAQNILDEYASITNMHTLASQSRQVVTIYALDHLLAYLGADFLIDFQRAHPSVILSVIDTTDEMAIEALSVKACDFALVTGPIDTQSFQATELFFTRYCARLRRNHPLSQKALLTDQDLSQQRIMSKGRAYRCFRHHIDRILLSKIPIELVAETADESIIQRLILEHDVINLGYDYAAGLYPHPDIISIPYHAPNDDHGQHIYLVQNKNTDLSQSAKAFREFILGRVHRNILES